MIEWFKWLTQLLLCSYKCCLWINYSPGELIEGICYLATTLVKLIETLTLGQFVTLKSTSSHPNSSVLSIIVDFGQHEGNDWMEFIKKQNKAEMVKN